MKRVVVAAVAVGVLGFAEPAAAQFGAGPGWSRGYYARGNFNVHFGGPNFAVKGFTAQVNVIRPFGTPLYPPYGGYPPAWGGGWAWSPPPPIVLLPPPAVAFNPAGLFPPNPDLAALNAQDPPRVPVNEKDFVAIRPGNPVRNLAANLPNPKPPVVIRPPAPPPPPVVVAFAEDRKADPKAESLRQVELAKAAFAGGEYGRATERLAAAVAAKPDEALPHFLLAQARFARSEYAEAVAAIRDGMALAPDWPSAAFRPKELYGPRPERFDAHAAELRKAVAANPGDPALGFLLGYQYWFTGEKDEAVRLFRRATTRVKDNAVIERFLRDAEKVAGR